MSRSQPIHKAISLVLKEAGEPLSASAIFERIQDRNLYDFKAKDPVHVVHSTLRRHCINLDFPSARRDKYFQVVEKDRYERLQTPVRAEPTAYRVQADGNRKKERVVTVPLDDRESDEQKTPLGPTHTEMQWRLLDLGSKLGLSVWAPMEDRGRDWNSHKVGDIHGLVDKLPGQFPPATLRTVKYIDVIWIKQQAIVAAFEIEHTSTMYSGLLRMSDLLTIQPNIQIKWYIVAPDKRFGKFANEVARPTFSAIRIPLHTVCHFLPYGKLVEKLDAAAGFIKHLRPEFLDDIAEGYDPEEAFDE